MELDLRLSRKDEVEVLNFFQEVFSKGGKVPDSLSMLWNDLSYERYVEEQKVAEAKFRHDDENFPILFEDNQIQVYKNPSGEIFVENKQNKNSTMRISTYGVGFQVTAHDANLSPWAINGLPAFVVMGRK